MNKFIKTGILALGLIAGATDASAQFNLKKAAGSLTKAAQAATLTDDQMVAYVKEYIDWMDKNNPVCPADNPYAIRLAKLTEGLTDVEGMPLNFKVYDVIDVNAFACADGSIRVFSSLMDIILLRIPSITRSSTDFPKIFVPQIPSSVSLIVLI